MYLAFSITYTFSTSLVLLILALICFVFAAVGVPRIPLGEGRSLDWQATGLALWTLSILVTGR